MLCCRLQLTLAQDCPQCSSSQAEAWAWRPSSSLLLIVFRRCSLRVLPVAAAQAQCICELTLCPALHGAAEAAASAAEANAAAVDPDCAHFRLGSTVDGNRGCAWLLWEGCACTCCSRSKHAQPAAVLLGRCDLLHDDGHTRCHVIRRQLAAARAEPGSGSGHQCAPRLAVAAA